MVENKTTRELALSWWRGLTNEEQVNLSEKHFPGRDFILITTSSSKIQDMFVKENGND